MMNGIGRVFAAGLVVSAGPVLAQAWIGQVAGEMASRERESQCMAGVLSTDKETDEARVPATAAMQTYWAAAHASANADVSGAFHPSDKNRWQHGTTTLPAASLTSVTDPVARASAMLTAAPTRFVRAGDSGSAWGAWTATDAAGRPVGTYLASFRRQLGSWKLRSVSVDAPVPDDAFFAPYCHKQGDTAAFLAKAEADEARRAAKKARKEAERAARGA